VGGAEQCEPEALADDFVVVGDHHGDLAVFCHVGGFYEHGETPS
jgi:hypothetical protein